MQGHCKICYAIRVFLLCRMQLYFCCLQVHREGMCKMTKNKRLIDMRQNAGDSTMVQHADFFLCKATLKKNIYDGIPCTFYLQIGCCCCFGLFSHCRTLLAAGYFAKWCLLHVELWCLLQRPANREFIHIIIALKLDTGVYKCRYFINSKFLKVWRRAAKIDKANESLPSMYIIFKGLPLHFGCNLHIYQKT